MSTEISILMMVDLSKGAANIPECKGIYSNWKTAHDNVVVILCGKAAEWDIRESAVDTENLRVADESGTRCVQMNINFATLVADTRFEVS